MLDRRTKFIPYRFDFAPQNPEPFCLKSFLSQAQVSLVLIW